MPDPDFWLFLDQLVASSELVLDRPAGSAHPRYPDLIYPLDYGYLSGTHAIDQGGIDVWSGSLPSRRVTGIVCTVDLTKRDAEMKILLGCTAGEARTILAFHNSGTQSAVFVPRGASLAPGDTQEDT